MSHHAAEIPVKRKLGRPPIDPADRLTERVDVFFSIAAKLKLAEDAKACGLTPAAYIRKLVDGYRPTAKAEHSADPRLLLELNAIGNNLGQTLREIKPDNPAKADWQDLKRLLESVLQTVALEEFSVSPKLLLQLNAAGTQLNRAVADMHAGSARKHDWHEIRLTLQNLLYQLTESHVH